MGRAGLWLVLAVVAVAGGVGGAQPATGVEPASRWLTSLQAGQGWNAPGYDTDGWVMVTCDLATGAPVWMSPDQQARHPLMWHPAGPHTGSPVYFRRQLWLGGKVTTAACRVWAKDQFRFYVNGRPAGGQLPLGETGNYEVGGWLRPGANVLAVEAMNLKPRGWGLVVLGRVSQKWPFTAGEKNGWRCSPRVGPGWTGSDYDDRQWPAAVPDPAPPMVITGEGTFACFTSPEPPGDLGKVYFRRHLDLDGRPVGGTLTILGDDGYELYVNGKLLAIERRVDRAYRPVQVDLSEVLRRGRNTLAVKLTNVWGPARLYCLPTVTMEL